MLPAAWPPGESQKFYIYHQMATGDLYNIKCGAPRLAATNLPLVSCVQVGVGGIIAVIMQCTVPMRLSVLVCHVLRLTCLCLLARMQVQDKSKSVKDEIELTLINLTGQTIQPGSQQVTFSVAVATLGSP